MNPVVTTWYLEQTSPADLLPAAEPPAPAGIKVVRAGVPSPEFSRFLYMSVGADVSWTDRLSWSHEQWRRYLDQPGTETWVAYEQGTPAGYIELRGEDDSAVEIAYFGLLPAFRRRGIGGHLLSLGTARAWDLAERWPYRQPTKRVWVHTCSLDGRHARSNYASRGFRLFDTRTKPLNCG